MLFTDILNKKTAILQPEFDKLFEAIIKNQSHEGDLLLIRVNGFYNQEVNEWDNILNKNPYMIGLSLDAHSDLCHYNFINNYRQNSVSNFNYNEYLENIQWSSEKDEIVNGLIEKETMSIQLEMMVYLKIWEADLFIKKLYQIARLSKGEPYDWHFKIAGSNRDKEATGKREKIIKNKARDILKDNYPNIYSAINNAYITQIRNCIAHSNYSFSGRYIWVNNYVKNDPHSQIRVVRFDDWIEKLHNTMVIYNQLIRFSHRIDDLYYNAAKENNMLFQIRVNRLDPIQKTEYYFLEYRQEFNIWGFKQ